MKLVATTILRSVSSLLPVLFLVGLSVLIFAILGMDYYKGAFNRACFESEQMFCNKGKIHLISQPLLIWIFIFWCCLFSRFHVGTSFPRCMYINFVNKLFISFIFIYDVNNISFMIK